MKIIVFEDEPSLSMLIQDCLEDRGHDVTPLFGARNIQFDHVTGITPSGQDIELTTSDFDLAIVDGKLLGRLQGWDIVPRLAAANLCCIAHSNSVDSNRLMTDAGAQYAALKTGLDNIQAVIAQIEESRH